jgi:hypothetical protein
MVDPFRKVVIELMGHIGDMLIINSKLYFDHHKEELIT